MTALFSAIKSITAIDNPSNHIINASDFKGIYYSGYLFETNYSDIFLNREELKSSKDVLTHYADFSNDAEEIARELAFEQMKLIYIRDIKICRFNFSIVATLSCLITGFFIYMYSKILNLI